MAVPVTVATPQPLTRPVASSYVGELSSRMGSRLVGITSKATPVAEATAIPAMLSFGDVTVGQTGTNTLTVSNSGKAQLTISQITLEGSGFSVSRSLPISVDAGGQTTINFLFKPTVAGSLIGQLSIVSNAVNSAVTIPNDRDRCGDKEHLDFQENPADRHPNDSNNRSNDADDSDHHPNHDQSNHSDNANQRHATDEHLDQHPSSCKHLHPERQLHQLELRLSQHSQQRPADLDTDQCG